MIFAYTNEQMRLFDQTTIENGTPEDTLMERAGSALSKVVLRKMGELGVSDVLILCGGGNNGGDGFVCAELLRKEGYDCAVLCMAENFSPACERAKRKYQGEVYARPIRRRFAIIVDCIFGTGLSRAPEGNAGMLVELIENSGAYVISADLPSGLKEGGVAYSPCVHADETVCMGQLKQALLLQNGADCAGKITLADLGIFPTQSGAEVWQERDVAKYFPQKKKCTHKGDFGRVGIVAESVCGSGASFLSVGGSLKSGAGYTTLYCTNDLLPLAVGKYPACVLKNVEDFERETSSLNAIAIGMGAGVSEGLYLRICKLLKEYEGTLILDADAINTLAKYGVPILKKKKCKVVLTPHLKEFSRISGLPLNAVISDMVGCASAFAREYQVTVLLKSNASVISDGSRLAINVEGSPALAKGGSGDILSGLLAGTCARGVAPFESCCVASYLLGKAGKLCAEKLGEYSPDGTDIISFLPFAVHSLSGGAE